MTDLIGEMIGQYRIQRELGRGGMAVVYQAYQAPLNRNVAIKVLLPQFASDPTFLGRFQQEARAVARLRHPNIVAVYDVGVRGDLHFIVMEELVGTPLGVLLAQEKRLPFARAVNITCQIAAALSYAHARGIVHRDVKPANVIVSTDDHVTLTDFGIAKAAEGMRLTQSGTVIGTPEYMAPEQALGETVSPASDVYSLGIVLYEMLAGQVPFQGANAASVLYRHVHELPPSIRTYVPDLPPRVEGVLQGALVKDAKARYATADEFAHDLAAVFDVPGKVSTTAPQARSRRRQERTRSRPVTLSRAKGLLVGVVGLAIILALALLLPLGFRPFGVGVEAPEVPSPVAAVTYAATLVSQPSGPLPVVTPAPSPVPTPVFVAARSPAIPPEPRATVVFDWEPVAAARNNFEESGGGWPSIEESNSWWRVSDGEYRLTIGPRNRMIWMWRGINVGAFSVAVDARTVTGHSDVHFGLIFRGRGTADYYQLDFAPNLGYELSKRVNDEVVVLVRRTRLPPSRLTDPVRLAVTAVGPRIQIAVNGQAVEAIIDDTHARGDLALYGVSGEDPDAEFGFDNYFFEPAVSEAVPVALVPYLDATSQFSLYIPDDWTESIDEYGVNFDSSDRFARAFVNQVPGVQPEDTGADVARKYIDAARSVFQNIAEGESQTGKVGDLPAHDQVLRAQIMGVEVRLRLLAVNYDGRGYVVVSAVAVSREAAFRPLLDFIIESFQIGGHLSIALSPTANDVATPEAAELRETGQPSLTAAPGIIPRRSMNVRGGPGTDYGVIGAARPEQLYAVTGRTADGDWWRIDFEGEEGWVLAELVAAQGELGSTKVVLGIPLPPSRTPTVATVASGIAPGSVTPTQALTEVTLSGRIAYSFWDPGLGNYHIVLRNADGSGAEHVYQGATQPDFCQKPANRIVANGTRQGLEGTIVIDLGRDEREVIPNTADTLPACSPEGQRVVFQSSREGERQIWLHRDINVHDDGASYKLGPTYFGNYPTWSRRWQIIWRGCNFWSGNGGDCGLWQLPDSGRGSPVRVSSGASDTAPDASPDGRAVAYMSREPGRWQVFTASADGGGNIQLTEDGDNGLPTWSPDGHAIAFVSNRDGGWGLWVMGVDGTNQRKIATLESGFGQGPIDWTEQRISWGS